MEEVGKLTPGMFAALCKQRTQEFRRQVWLQNLTVAAVFNAQRTKSDDHYFTPWDFIPDPTRDEGHLSIVHALRGMLKQPFGLDENGNVKPWTAEALENFKQHWIKLLTGKGHENAEAILHDVFKG